MLRSVHRLRTVVFVRRQLHTDDHGGSRSPNLEAISMGWTILNPDQRLVMARRAECNLKLLQSPELDMRVAHICGDLCAHENFGAGHHADGLCRGCRDDFRLVLRCSPISFCKNAVSFSLAPCTKVTDSPSIPPVVAQLVWLDCFPVSFENSEMP